MNLKKFEALAGKWRLDAVWLTTAPTDDYRKHMAMTKMECADAVNKIVSDTRDEEEKMSLVGMVNVDDYCLCDGCGLPIEPTRMFHSDRCVRRYSKAHAKDHGKENEDE